MGSYENNISLSGQHLNINSWGQDLVTISVGLSFQKVKVIGEMFTLSPAMTRPHTQERLLSLFEQSPGSPASLWVTCHPLIGHWWSLRPSHWSESLLTATNWAWNLLEQNTTSHFLITSSFSHVVIAKKLISLLTKQRNISISKYYHCISLRIAH